MKNIHVIPTDKPSRLAYDFYEKFYLLSEDTKFFEFQNLVQNRELFITSDEEIKEGDWFICQHGFEKKCVGTTIINNEVYLLDYLGNTDRLIWCKKIILTTDQDLIKDGVQAIDDEFLEWFVKNPSCEWVEIKDSSIVKEHIWDGSNDGEIVWRKKIIIPKEEQKQNLIDMMQDDEKLGLYEETFEEAAERFLSKEDLDLSDWDKRHILKAMVNMTKWQAERSYSEKQMDDAYDKGFKDAIERMYSEDEVRAFAYNAFCLGQLQNPTENKFNGWFEQFKKK